MVAEGGGKPLVENMKTRLLTKFIAKKVDPQLHFSKGSWQGQLLCVAMVMPKHNELIRRISSFHPSQTFG